MTVSGFGLIFEVELELAKFTGAPYAILTDCCTHALELAMILDSVDSTTLPCKTYISVPMMLMKLGIKFTYTDEQWCGEYQFGGTRIWDSARRLEPNMYRTGQIQCLSFGYDKPIPVGRGGAILVDDEDLAKRLSKMRSDGRDLSISPWESQESFELGYHYRPTIEESVKIGHALSKYALTPQSPVFKDYPDLRNIQIN